MMAIEGYTLKMTYSVKKDGMLIPYKVDMDFIQKHNTVMKGKPMWSSTYLKNVTYTSRIQKKFVFGTQNQPKQSLSVCSLHFTSPGVLHGQTGWHKNIFYEWLLSQGAEKVDAVELTFSKGLAGNLDGFNVSSNLALLGKYKAICRYATC